MPCTCKREPLVAAQLMRLHIVTPKAPVTLTLNPKVVVRIYFFIRLQGIPKKPPFGHFLEKIFFLQNDSLGIFSSKPLENASQTMKYLFSYFQVGIPTENF
jgi:hypothetical protein